MINSIKPLLGKLTSFAQKRLGFERPPKLFLRNDSENASNILGKTAFYDPNNKAITIFISSRHPKDILRSFAHELVHHTQNLRGDLSAEKCGKMTGTYAQDNGHMRNMEKEAYLLGNMCFRDWEDSCKFSMAESRLLKENKKMSNKITRQEIVEMIKGAILEKTKRAGHQVVGRPVPDDRIKPLEEEDIEDCEGVDCPPQLEEEKPPAVGAPMSTQSAMARPSTKKKVDEGDEDCGCTDLDGTPEKEANLYEDRFSVRNSMLFEKLAKKWAR